jgi:pyruvate kinase
MTYMKKTKIVATIGPASDSVGTLRKMIRAGLNVARVNCAHGSHEEWTKRIEAVREASDKEKANVAILLDLSGPKIRTGDFATETVNLKRGQIFVLTTEKIIGDNKKVWVNFARLPKEVRPGMLIMLDDGKLVLRVIRTKGATIETVVDVGGIIRGRRGVNVPAAQLSIATITAKDKRDIDFGVKKGIDLFALSFVRNEKDIIALRKILVGKRSRANIVAKIETQGALDRLEEIVTATDAVMVARGDLAVEIPKEEVPLAQKRIIRSGGRAGKTVITATQMLDSMTTSSTPTRAEIGDVANAIFDGTDAVMLSQESAMGVDPVHVVDTMASIARHTEQSALYHETVQRFADCHGTVDTVSSAVARSVSLTGAVAIVALTESGFTPGMVARHKPDVPVLSLTPIGTTHRKLSLNYGIISRITPPVRDIDAALSLARKELVRAKLATKGDTFILVCGMPFGNTGGTNTMVIQTV